tara:strand:+ start:11022 stop:12014 length:993 start_codon:yes stop_codon:yes gene_type:complete
VETTEEFDSTIDAVANSLLVNPKQDSKPDSDTPEVEPEDLQEEELVEEEKEEELVKEEEEAELENNEVDEDEAEESIDEDQEAPEHYSVKVDGEEIQVSLDDLTRSYSGQAYIQKGMQEAANVKKEAESVYSELLQERQQMSELLNQVQSGQMTQAPLAPTKELFNKDPIGYMEAKLEYDDAKVEFDKQQSSIQQAYTQQSQQMEHAKAVHLKGEMQKLSQIIPEFSNPEKAGKLKDDLISGGVRLGFSEAELAEVSDHRALVTLYKAMKYDQIIEGRGKAEQKSTGARKMIKPGAKKSTSLSKTKARDGVAARMKQTGDINDVASYILS